ncbi:sensor domain-containing diguanylate cyclase [Ancylobacter terrae]|uniref:sensor domain-containing diguanylate cyclase n=1 Tax=Ancylobacter sp. sgz301288 TaxID=3342077 RepID=UPI00385CBF9E
MTRRRPTSYGDDALPAKATEVAARAFGHAAAALCETDRDLVIRLANAAFGQLFGMPPSELIGRRMGVAVPALAAVEAQLRDTSAEAPVGRECSCHRDGMTLAVASVRTADGYSIAVRDVTGEQRVLALLQESVERSSFALDSAGQWVWDFDIVANKVWRSPQWKRALGFEPAELADEDEPWRIVHPSDRRNVDNAMTGILQGKRTSFEATYRLRHRDGTWRWILSRGTVIAFAPDGSPARVLATSVDITHQKEIERELEATIRQRKALEHDLVLANRRLRMLAEIDSLTELPNRRKFDKVLEREFRRVRRDNPTMALLMIDVDYFKKFNDLYGHPAGDECLRSVAEALQHVVRASRDIVTRYGGEEFAAIIVNTAEDEARSVAKRMADAVQGLAIPHAGSPFGVVTICVGLTLFGLQNRTVSPTPQRLLQASDQALYAAKDAGRNRVAIARLASDGSVATDLADVRPSLSAGITEPQ